MYVCVEFIDLIDLESTETIDTKFCTHILWDMGSVYGS